jgi:hypothetical protein
MQDADQVQDIQFAGVSTGWGSDGDWVCCRPHPSLPPHNSIQDHSKLSTISPTFYNLLLRNAYL